MEACGKLRENAGNCGELWKIAVTCIQIKAIRVLNLRKDAEKCGKQRKQPDPSYTDFAPAGLQRYEEEATFAKPCWTDFGVFLPLRSSGLQASPFIQKLSVHPSPLPSTSLLLLLLSLVRARVCSTVVSDISPQHVGHNLSDSLTRLTPHLCYYRQVIS